MQKTAFPWFLKKYANEDETTARTKIGKVSGWVGIVCNLLLFGMKLLVGTLSGSVSITADAMNNLSDASSSVVTLIGFRLAEKPADADHPYGHARFEYLSGLAVAAMIMVIGFELAKGSIEKIVFPTEVEFTPITAGVLLGSIAVKLWLGHFNEKLGKLIHSRTLLAAATDSRNDCIATGAVLVAAVTQRLSGIQIDGYVGLLVALFILYTGATLGKETISPLLGEAASPELRALIVDYVNKQPDVLGYHDLMVHDYGPGQRFATLHVEMDNRQDPLYCHERIDDMERECLKSHNIHLVIHYDPIVTDDPESNRMRDSVIRELTAQDPRLQIHDFRMVQGAGHTNLIFDVSLPEDLRGEENNIQARLEQTLTALENQQIYTVITFDPAAFNDDNVM